MKPSHGFVLRQHPPHPTPEQQRTEYMEVGPSPDSLDSMLKQEEEAQRQLPSCPAHQRTCGGEAGGRWGRCPRSPGRAARAGSSV